MFLLTLLFLMLSPVTFSMDTNNEGGSSNIESGEADSDDETVYHPADEEIKKENGGESSNSNKDKRFLLPILTPRSSSMGFSGLASAESKELMVLNPAAKLKGFNYFISVGKVLSDNSMQPGSIVMFCKYDWDRFGLSGGLIGGDYADSSRLYIGANGTISNFSLGGKFLIASPGNNNNKGEKSAFLMDLGAIWKSKIGSFAAVLEGFQIRSSLDSFSLNSNNLKLGFSKKLQIEKYLKSMKGDFEVNIGVEDALFKNDNLALFDKLKIGAEFIPKWKHKCSFRAGLDGKIICGGVGYTYSGVEIAVGKLSHFKDAADVEKEDKKSSTFSLTVSL